MQVGGLIDWGSGKRYIVVTPPGHEKDSNYLLTQVYGLLRASKLSGQPDAQAQRLVLHHDGGSENSNFAVLSFAHFLIEKVRFVLAAHPRLPLFTSALR